MKIHLIDGPQHNQIVEHSEINRPYYFKYPIIIDKKQIIEDFKNPRMIPFNELEKFRYYIYLYSHKTNDGIIHFKYENP